MRRPSAMPGHHLRWAVSYDVPEELAVMVCASATAVDADLGARRAVIGRYLHAFEAGRLSEITCAHRLQALEREIAGLAARKASLESQCEQAPVLPADGDLREWRGRIELAVAHAAPEQLKLLLGAMVDRILVESRACIQPYFTALGVRTLGPSRRRTGTRTNHGAHGPSLWVNARMWGRIDCFSAPPTNRGRGHRNQAGGSR
jgi:hypothetical protein